MHKYFVKNRGYFMKEKRHSIKSITTVCMCPPLTPPGEIGRGIFNYYVGTSSPHPYEKSSVTFCMCPPPSGRDEPCPYMSPHPCEESSVTFCMCPPTSGRDEPCPYMSPHPYKKSSVTFYMCPLPSGRDESCADKSARYA